MITADCPSAPLLRTSVDLDAGHGAVVAAVLRATALGVVEARLNGVPASPDVLTPGWSAYEQRLRYAEWDVRELIRPTTIVVLSVGNGWYRGRMGWLGMQSVYGPERAAAAELLLTFEDGHRQTVVTDEHWQAASSGVLSDDWYDGQVTDTRLLMPADAHLAPDDVWTQARVVDFDPSVLEPYIGPPVRRHEEIAPTVVGRTAEGHLLLDFRQNIVGWLRIRVQGAEGAELVVRHAEVLEDGDLSVRPLRSAAAVDRYVLSGAEDVLEPTFTFHGFQYATIEGWTGTDESAVEAVKAVVVGSVLERTGHFSCSDADLTRLHENVVWGMRGNFLEVPTDCPQRDERMGYIGDLAAFAPTAAYLFDVRDFMRDWLRDLSLEQEKAGGLVPIVVPDVLKYETGMYTPPEGVVIKPAPMALYHDGAVWIPWALYEQYGDLRFLEEQRRSVADYLKLIEDTLNEDGTLTEGFQLGDWLDPAAPPEDPSAARADREVLATACMYRSVDLAARMARALGDDEEAERRALVADRIRQGFTTRYVGTDGRIRSDAPTVYALAIAFGLVSGAGARAAGDRLAQLVADGGHVIATGFVGTPFILHALSASGHTDTAYRLLTQKECPSWLYQVSMGATTIWERWDAIRPDGSVNPGEMTSFNHYAFGSVADWMHRVVAGLSPLEPGYRRVLFAPRPGGGLSSAAARVRTPQGEAAIDWSIDGDRIRAAVQVPEGTEGILSLPGMAERTLAPGRHQIEERVPVL
ncbi:family 78 glycoside hydrolase catalytic domain [Streptomyces sp. QL37]|uniref:alpha-L-rhamnosidase n=1 Tax=Streptomyces sp. QL37 TaxID=2093747 RepID=UPI000CF284C5|nr:alpha-L-rhamnosidase [Streptomyces sp. QL37]PPQ56443.1 alpha-L-rhamnosidase [Streptomyces sp. QL37]